MIDVNKYRKGRYITVAGFEDPREEIVAEVRENKKYERLELAFESGDILPLNATRLEVMIAHYGSDERLWPGKRIALDAGEVPFNGKLVRSILLSPVSPDVPK